MTFSRRTNRKGRRSSTQTCMRRLNTQSLAAYLSTMSEERSGSSYFLVGNSFKTGVSCGPHLDTTKGGTQPESVPNSIDTIPTTTLHSILKDKSEKGFRPSQVATRRPSVQSSLRFSIPIFQAENHSDQACHGESFREDDITTDNNEFDNLTCCSCDKESKKQGAVPMHSLRTPHMSEMSSV